MMKRGFTIEEAERIATELGIEWPNVAFDVEQFRKGLDVELEHGKKFGLRETNVTNDDPILTGKIVLAHLFERPDYYELLELVEKAPPSEKGEPLTLKELADAASGYARTVSFAETQTSEKGRAMSEHPNFIKVAGQLYQLEPEEAPSAIKVNGFTYDRVEDEPSPEPEAPTAIKVGGVVFHRLDVVEAAKKGKKKNDKKKGGKKSKKDGKQPKQPAKKEKKDDKKGKGKWNTLPKGWTKKSAKSFWNSIGGSVTDCKRKLKDAKEIDNTGAFCASLKDLMEGEGWRKSPRKKSKKASAAPQFITYKGVRFQLED